MLESDAVFSFSGRFSLSMTDEEVLSLLYLPIIKSDAFSIYHYFLSLQDMNEYFASATLLNHLGISTADFLIATSRLEAIGLLETYKVKESKDTIRNAYIYKLIPPATPKKFFSDVLYRNLLVSTVGQKTYFSLLNHFKVEQQLDPSKLINMSSQFKDIYLSEIDSVSIADEDTSDIQSKSYKSIINFSEEDLRERMKEDNQKITLSDNQIDSIMKTAVLYNVSLETVCQLISECTNSSGRFFMNRFNSACKKINKYTPEKPGSSSDAMGDSKTLEFIKTISSMSPQEFLKIRFNIAELPNYMYDEIEKMSKEFYLSNDLINVVLDYSLRKTKTFNSLYIDKVSTSLKAAGISKAYDAMVFLNEHDFTSSKHKKANVQNKIKDAKLEEDDISTEDIANLKDSLDL